MKRFGKAFGTAVLLLMLMLLAGTALGEAGSSMKMKRWSNAEITDLFQYNLNFCAIDETTGEIIDEDGFSLHLKSNGILSQEIGEQLGKDSWLYKLLQMERYASYTRDAGRGVFENLLWRPDYSKYITDLKLDVTRVPAGYRIPTGYGTFVLDQDFAGLPEKLQKVLNYGLKAIKYGTKILDVIPGVGKLVSPIKYLLQTGVVNEISNHGDFKLTSHVKNLDWYAPWACYRWLTVELSPKYANTVSFIVSSYDENNPPKLYDENGKEYPLSYTGQYTLKTKDGDRAYPKFTASQLYAGTYRFYYNGRWRTFEVDTDLTIPRDEQGCLDRDAYDALPEKTKQIIAHNGGVKRSSSGAVLVYDNDWTTLELQEGQMMCLADELEAVDHVIICGYEMDGYYKLDTPEKEVTVNVVYDGMTGEMQEDVYFYEMVTDANGTVRSYLGGKKGPSSGSGLTDTIDYSLREGATTDTIYWNQTAGMLSKTYPKEEASEIRELLGQGPSVAGIEPVREDVEWYTEHSMQLDEVHNIEYHTYTVHLRPKASGTSVTFYPIDENEQLLSKRYNRVYSTWTTDEPVMFTLQDLSAGEQTYLRPDNTDRVQYTLHLESNKTYQLRLKYSTTGFYRTKDAVWTIITGADGSVLSFTPDENTETTGRAKLEENGEYSLLLLFRNSIDLTVKKEWLSLLGTAVEAEEEPADYVAVLLTSERTGIQNLVELRADREWTAELKVAPYDFFDVTILAVSKDGYDVTGAEGWDDLQHPLEGWQSSGSDSIDFEGIAYPGEKKAYTLHLRNLQDHFSFYKTNGISFVTGYSFSLRDCQITQQNTTINGVPAVAYTVSLGDALKSYRSATYQMQMKPKLREYDENGTEIGYWNVSVDAGGILTLDGMYYEPYAMGPTLQAEGSGFRIGVELTQEDEETPLVLNLLDNGTRRSRDTYTVTIRKQWSQDIADQMDTVTVQLQPIALGSDLTGTVTPLTDIGISNAVQTITLSAANGWQSEVYLRKGVIYWAFEVEASAREGAEEPKYAVSYYIQKQNKLQTLTEKWQLYYAGEEEAFVFGPDDDDSISGALLCEANGAEANSGKQDVLNIVNASDSYHSFQVNIVVEKGTGKVTATPRSYRVILERFDSETNGWVSESQKSIYGTESQYTLRFDELSALERYRVRLRYEDEADGTIENSAFVLVNNGRICKLPESYSNVKGQAVYALVYDDSRNDTDNLQTITLSPAGALKLYVSFVDGNNAGGNRPASVSYEILRNKTGEEPASFGCTGAVTHYGASDPTSVAISPYDPTQYSYTLKLDGEYDVDGISYLQTANGTLYRIERETSASAVSIYLYEQKQLTIRKLWNTDAEALDCPTDIPVVLERYARENRISAWREDRSLTLDDENDWGEALWVDAWHTNSEAYTYRVREMNQANEAVAEGGMVQWLIPEKENQAGETLAEHTTLYRVSYPASDKADELLICNTAVMEYNLYKSWSLPDNYSPMDLVVLGLYARAEGTADEAQLVTSPYTNGVKIGDASYAYGVTSARQNWKLSFKADKYDAQGRKLIYTGVELNEANCPAPLTLDTVLTALKLSTAQQTTYKAQIVNYQCVSGEATSLFNDTEGSIALVNIPKVPDGDDRITVYKVWDDEADHSSDTVSISLTYQGQNAGNAVLDAAHDWTCSFTGLGGELSKYVLTETVPNGYYAEYESYLGGRVWIVTNHPYGEVDVIITKQWDSDILVLPTSVSFTLTKNVWKDEQLDIVTETSVMLTPDGSGKWQKTLTGLDARDAQGNEYIYTLKESAIDGDAELLEAFNSEISSNVTEDGADFSYHFTCTNTLKNDDDLELDIYKAWNDGSAAWQDAVSLKLLARAYGSSQWVQLDSFTLSAEDVLEGQSWTKQLYVPAKDYLGREISYTVSEEAMAGYTAKIQVGTVSEGICKIVVSNQNTGMLAVLRWIGDGDTEPRPTGTILRLQEQQPDGSWVDSEKAGQKVQLVLPEATAEYEAGAEYQYTAAFTDLDPSVNYRVRVCYLKNGSYAVQEQDGLLVVEAGALSVYKTAKAAEGYQVQYSTVANGDSFPIQMITMNKLLDVEVQWLDNSNAGNTRPEELPLVLEVADAGGENWKDTGTRQKISAWEGDSGHGIFALSEANAYDTATIGRARVQGTVQQGERTLWQAPGGTWYTVSYQSGENPWQQTIILQEQKQISVRLAWDIDYLELDRPDEVQVRLESVLTEDDVAGTPIETITLKAEGTDAAKSWQGTFALVDRYALSGDSVLLQSEILYRVRELYPETVDGTETGALLTAQDGGDAVYSVESYTDLSGEVKAHNTRYLVSYEKQGDTFVVSNLAVLDFTIQKYWQLLGAGEKPQAVYLVLTSRCKEAYRDIAAQMGISDEDITSYKTVASPLDGDMALVSGQKLKYAVGKAQAASAAGEKDWTVDFRVKKYGQLGLPQDYRCGELVSTLEDTELATLLPQLRLEEDYQVMEDFISFAYAPTFLKDDTHGNGIVVNVWNGNEPTPTVTPNPTASNTPSPTTSNTPSPTVSSSPTVTASPTPTVTASSSPTVTASPAPTVTASPTPTVTASSSPTPTSSATPGPSETATPTPVVPGNKIISVLKVWDDEDAANRPEAVTVHVKRLADDQTVYSFTLNAANGWMGFWTEASNTESYKLEEVVPEGYTVSYTLSAYGSFEQWLVMNTLNPQQTTEMTVRKSWQDTGDHSADAVQVQLYKDGEAAGTAILTQATNWVYSFSDLEAGHVYTVEEEAMAGYVTSYERQTDYTVIYNKPVDRQLATLVVKKEWQNMPAGQTPESLQLKLLRDGLVVNTVTLYASQDWSGSLTTDSEGNPLYLQDENGRSYVYTLYEPEVPEGCECYISQRQLATGELELTATNSYTNLLSYRLTVTKVWNEQSPQTHDAVQVLILADGVEAETVILSAENAWTVTRLLREFDEEGAAISYSVLEVPVEGYSTTYTEDEASHSFTITNTPWAEAETSVILGNFVDTLSGGNAERLFNFTVNLEDENGEQVDYAYMLLQKKSGNIGTAVALTQSGYSFQLRSDEYLLIPNVPEGWTYYIEEVPTEDEAKAYDCLVYVNGVKQDTPLLTASLVKATVPLVRTIFAQGSKGSKQDLITYTHVLKTEDITVSKIWEDSRDDSVSFILYRNDEKYDTDPACIRSGNEYCFENLQKYEDKGDTVERIIWSLKERSVEGYWSIYSNVTPYEEETDRLYDCGTVYNRPYQTFTFTKVWAGGKPGTITLEVTSQSGKKHTRKVKTTEKEGTYTLYLSKYDGGELAVYTATEVTEEGIIASYQNIGENAAVTDRIYNGGTITNTSIPRTGDDTQLALYVAGLLLAGSVLSLLLVQKRRQKKGTSGR